MEEAYDYSDSESRPEWTSILIEQVDHDSVTYLRNYSRAYVQISEDQKELMEKYPKLVEVLNGDGRITLEMEEHAALKQVLELRGAKEGMEREQYYLQGHRHCYQYFKQILKPNIEIE